MKTENRLLNNFLLALKSDEKSENTINSYETDIVQLLKYIRENRGITESIDTFDKAFYNSVKYQDLEYFMNYLTAENDASSTRARKVASIKAFFGYLANTLEVISNNPASKLKTPKLQKDKKPIYLSLDESKKLLKHVGGRNKERDFAILTIFLNCGLRLSELVKINLEHINEDELTVIGKGNKVREVILTLACLSAIEKYLKVRPDVNEKALFLSERKQRISKSMVKELVKTHIGEAGLDTDKYSVHKLRHTAASLTYLYGEQDLKGIQQMLGHESIATTQIYTHIDKKQQRKVANSNPLSNII